jgi:hypothetical protein
MDSELLGQMILPVIPCGYQLSKALVIPGVLMDSELLGQMILPVIPGVLMNSELLGQMILPVIPCGYRALSTQSVIHNIKNIYYI